MDILSCYKWIKTIYYHINFLMTFFCHFNLYTYICWYVVETSLVLFWLSLVILCNFGKCSERFVWPWNKLLENLWKSSESGQKSLENCHKHCYMYVLWICYIKGELNDCLRLKKTYFLVLKECFTCLLHLLVKYFWTLKHRFCIPSWPCTYVISSIYYTFEW